MLRWVSQKLTKKRVVEEEKKYKEYPFNDWLEVLNEDQFLTCIAWLDVRSVYVCLQVCKKWNNVSLKNGLWADIYKRDFPRKGLRDPLKAKLWYQDAVAERKREREWQAESQRRARLIQESNRMVCRMFHPSNGRDNFLPFSPTVPMEEMPSRETLMKILAMDNELRLSKEVQHEYWISDYPSGVTLEVQTLAVKKYGYDNPWIIPSALSYYKDDPEIMSIPHYAKYNRSQQGKIECGDAVPDIPLTTMQGCATSMRTLLEPHASAPVVLVAGSYT